MVVPPLKLRPARDPDRLPFLDGIGLLRGRVHEFCGPARVTAAMWLARGAEGPVVWIAPAHGREAVNPDGMRAFLDPGRVIFVAPERAPDLLWSMEETLRAGAVALVVAELAAPPALTPVRRLTLAAEAGAALTGHPPTGLILTPGAGGAAGVESRWHLAPQHRGAEREWRLERLRARLEPPRTWKVHAEGREPRLESEPPAGGVKTK